MRTLDKPESFDETMIDRAYAWLKGAAAVCAPLADGAHPGVVRVPAISRFVRIPAISRLVEIPAKSRLVQIPAISGAVRIPAVSVECEYPRTMPLVSLCSRRAC